MATGTTRSGDPVGGPALRDPGWRLLANEALAGLDAARLVPHLPRVVLARRGTTPRDVLVIPGWLATDRSTSLVRAVLTRDGHRVQGWARGRNRGDIEGHVAALVASVRRRADAVDGPIDLVGQSLGGTMAREVARRTPTSVRRIVTFGTPLHGPAGTVFEALFDPAGSRPTPPPVPTTIVWSRKDGIVGWRAQLDLDNPWAEHVEVRSRHLGMGADPAVLAVVRERVGAQVGGSLRAVPNADA